jgi:hypothetical protein
MEPSLLKELLSQSKTASAETKEQDKKFSVPKELWRMVDFLYKFGMTVNDLLIVSGHEKMMAYLRECIDKGLEFDLEAIWTGNNSLSMEPLDLNEKVTEEPLKHLPLPRELKSLGKEEAVKSMFALLLQFLTSLEEPVVPYEFYSRCVHEGYISSAAANQMLPHFPLVHKHVFLYVTSFLKEMTVNYQGNPSIDADKLGKAS